MNVSLLGSPESSCIGKLFTFQLVLTVVRYYPLPYTLDASHLFERLRCLGQAVILDSCYPYSQFGRYDIISAAPAKLAQLKPEGLVYKEHNQTTWQTSQQLPLDLLTSWLDAIHIDAVEEIPFKGGMIGYFSYDLGRHFERIPNQASADIALPDLHVGLYLQAVVIDHHTQQSWLVVHPLADPKTVQQFQDILDRLQDEQPHHDASSFQLASPFTSNLSAEEYKLAINKIHHYIEAGDCYQINFAQRFSTSYTGDPWHAWQLLKRVAPTPFAAYMDLDSDAILSLSPERFLFSDAEGNVETRPIKGTRPRSEKIDEDQFNAKALLASEKDRAENVMIVDLLRNDISKVCEPGSVKVPELFKLETYPNVHHLVSSVTGKLDKKHSPLDLLRACFPGGSITGAPKIRAMEIIDELEPHRRSVYCGSIAYISSCGQMDSSITIRTLICHNQQIYCWAGGGIVADSSADDEYAETFSKVNNLLKALEATID